MGVSQFLRFLSNLSGKERESGNPKDMRHETTNAEDQYSMHLRNSMQRESENASQFLESFSAATDRRHDWRVVDIDDAGRGKRRSVRHVAHEKVNGLIRVNSPKRVFTKRDRQPRAFQHRPRHRLRPRFITRIARLRFVRVAWSRSRSGGPGGPDSPPYVARAFAERDEHTQGGHGFEHGKRVTFRLVERVFFLFCA
jgi:hypothetical protein